MIHVRADQVKNTKNAVADNFSGSRYSESHLLRCDLYRTENNGDSTFSRFWLVCGSIGIAGSVLIRLYGMPWIVELLIGITVCLLLLAEMKIITGMCGKPLEKGATGTGRRWIIVLGAQVRGRKITDSLKRRLDCALAYLTEHPDVHVIVSGGPGER